MVPTTFYKTMAKKRFEYSALSGNTDVKAETEHIPESCRLLLKGDEKVDDNHF